MSKDETKKHQVEIEELQQRLKRALADYDNLQKRTESEKETLIKRANLGLLREILPLLDLLQKAQDNLKDPAIDLVLKEFSRILGHQQLKEIKEVGVKFDPEIHEVVSTVLGDEELVTEVVAPGYSYDGWVLRPARVIVAKKESNNDKN